MPLDYSRDHPERESISGHDDPPGHCLMRSSLHPIAASTTLLSVVIAGCDAFPGSSTVLLREIEAPAAPPFQHHFATDTAYYMPESIAAGVAFLDYDDDGDMDTYVVDGAGRPGRLYRNEGSSFVDVTTESGIEPVRYGVGVSAADFDDDGLVDLYLTSVGPDALYRNTDGGFVEVTGAAGIKSDGWGTSASWVDFDRDGRLDLYVVNYLELSPGVRCSDRAGMLEYCGPRAHPGATDRLYRNLGGGRFEDVTVGSGIGAKRGRGLGVATLDFDRDGWPDIYVANDGEPNFLWRNRGDGTFEDRALASGAALDASGQPEAGMGVAVGDVDRDGWTDVYVTHLAGESNTLYRNRSDGSFVDETAERGLHGPSLPFTGFGVALVDLDNDGDLDVLVANGRINRGPVAPGTPDGFLQAYAEPNSLYLNDGTGRFEARPDLAPDLAERPGMSRGLATGDIDDDGGLDVIIVETGRELRVLRNTTGHGHWIGFSVTDPGHGGRDALGARLQLWTPDGRREAYVNPNAGYLSSNDPRVHFGLGGTARADSLLVTWPDGGAEVFRTLRTDRYNAVRRGDGEVR